MLNGDAVPFRSAPVKARTTAVWGTLCYQGSLVVAALLLLRGSVSPDAFDASTVLLLVALVWLVVRAARISIVADDSRVIVANRIRTHVLRWEEIDRIEPTRRIVVYGTRVPGIRFQTTSGRRIVAQAVSDQRAEQANVLRRLGVLAPPSTTVIFDR